MEEQKVFTKKILVLVGSTAVVYALFTYILPLILPFLFAFPIAKGISSLAKKAEKYFHIKARLSASVVTLLLTSAAVILLYFALRGIGTQGAAFLRRFSEYQKVWFTYIQNFCCMCDDWMGLADGTVQGVVNDGMAKLSELFQTKILPALPEKGVQFFMQLVGAMTMIAITSIAVTLIRKDMDHLRQDYHNCFLYTHLNRLKKKLSVTGMAYVKAQLIIFSLVALICAAGLFLQGNQYALVLGLIIAFVDFLPILGSGTVLIPWSIIAFVQGNYLSMVILLTMYATSFVVRETLEPKLMGERIGIRPIYMLISIYIGLRLFGLSGVLLGPIGLALIQGIYEQWAV